MTIAITKVAEVGYRILKFRKQDKNSVEVLRRSLAASFELRNFIFENVDDIRLLVNPAAIEGRVNEFIREVHHTCELDGSVDELIQNAKQRAHNDVSQFDALNPELPNWLRYFSIMDYVVNRVIVEKCRLPFIWKRSVPLRLILRKMDRELDYVSADIELAVTKCARAFHVNGTSPRDVSGVKPCTLISSVGRRISNKVPLYRDHLINIAERTSQWSLSCYKFHYKSLTHSSDAEYECFAKLIPKKIRLHMYWSVCDKVSV